MATIPTQFINLSTTRGATTSSKLGIQFLVWGWGSVQILRGLDSPPDPLWLHPCPRHKDYMAFYTVSKCRHTVYDVIVQREQRLHPLTNSSKSWQYDQKITVIKWEFYFDSQAKTTLLAVSICCDVTFYWKSSNKVYKCWSISANDRSEVVR